MKSLSWGLGMTYVFLATFSSMIRARPLVWGEFPARTFGENTKARPGWGQESRGFLGNGFFSLKKKGLTQGRCTDSLIWCFEKDFPIFISKLGTRSRGDRAPWGDSFFLVSNLYHRKRFILVCFFSPFFHLDLWAKPRIGMASQGIRNAEPHREVQRLCSVPDTLPWEPNLQDEAENFWQGHGRPC